MNGIQVHKLSFSAKMFVYLLKEEFEGYIIAFARGEIAKHRIC